MTVADDVILPSEEELKHKEIPITCNYMLASAMWAGRYCDNHCKEFMLCKQEEADPRKCIAEGNKVTDCGLEFYRKVKKTCKEELEWYTKCLDFSSSEPLFNLCRREQAMFDGCMAKNGFERAPFGYFQFIRIHDTDRPKPKPHVPLFLDATQPYDATEEVADKPKGAFGTKPMFSALFNN